MYVCEVEQVREQVAFLKHTISKDGLSQVLQGFFTIVAPLTKPMRKNVYFVWTKECKANFQELKKQLTTAPILTLITRNGGFVVFTYVPNVSLRCVLIQDENVVPNDSRQLKEHERNYVTYHLELAAVMFALKIRRH